MILYFLHRKTACVILGWIILFSASFNSSLTIVENNIDHSNESFCKYEVVKSCLITQTISFNKCIERKSLPGQYILSHYGRVLNDKSFLFSRRINFIVDSHLSINQKSQTFLISHFSTGT